MDYCFTMKTIYTSLLWLMLSIPMVIAQNAGVESYFDDGTKWTTIHYADYGCNGFTDICYVQGDTTIAEKTYQKILYTHNDNNSRVIPIIADGQKIYAHIDAKDVLLYDFGLEVGDSIKWYDYLGEGIVGPREYAYVTKVDTVPLLDGRKAKRLHYDCRLSDIEFIGCEYGILSPFVMPAITTCGGTNACCSMNGEPIFETTPGFCENILRPATTWYGVTKIVSPFTNVRYQSTAYELRGDTIINDTTYHSLWRDNGIYCAGIRQTANGQQVYIRPTQELMRDPYWESGEHLLSDFAVQVGDTVWAFDGSYSGIDNIGEDLSIQYRWIVKSVQNIDGRKHVLVEGGQMHNHQVEWIEGIGTKYIFFENTYEDALYNSYTAYALCAADSEGNILY